MPVTLREGDCREVVKTIEADSIDAAVTDPPYSLVSIQKRYGKPGSAPTSGEGAAGVYRRGSAGFMGQQWDNGEVAFDPEFWSEVLRVMKPGAHLLAFGGTRTYHRLACAIEDAGFEIRDAVLWHYATGFPKSHDVAKSIDKAARGVPHGGPDPTSLHHGQYRTSATEGSRGDGDTGQGYGAGPGQFMATGKPVRRLRPGADQNKDGSWEKLDDRVYQPGTYVPASEAAQQWQGWGTALKPATEIICLARKPLSEPNIAANVLRWGTGAINIDGCRIETAENLNGGAYAEQGNRSVSPSMHDSTGMNVPGKTVGREFTQPVGRWPANLAHDNSDEVLAGFPDSAGAQGDVRGDEPSAVTKNVYADRRRVPFNKRIGEATAERRYTDEGSTNFAALPGMRRASPGSAARFFFSAKAGADDRYGSRHPTVKPVELMKWLCRLITPPAGTILDPFAGSGTTGVAAMAEGFDAMLIEREAQYCADIKERLAFYEGTGRHSTAAKNRNRTETKGSLL